MATSPWQGIRQIGVALPHECHSPLWRKSEGIRPGTGGRALNQDVLGVGEAAAAVPDTTALTTALVTLALTLTRKTVAITPVTGAK